VIELLLQAERAMEMGRIDAAETLYRQVVNADPRNGIAVVGLARVALERGDERGAYLTARKALAIDPENSAARRMVARLEEVLRYRGQPVPEPEDPGQVAGQPANPAPPLSPERPQGAGRSILDRIIRR
jgi:thioredoxin-like negative regulator of GroEL